MKVIIAGSRTFCFDKYPDALEILQKAIDESGFEVSEVVSGNQYTWRHGSVVGGADYVGEQWAQQVDVDLKCFQADWPGFGKAAGPIRNREMANYGEALIALWDGSSRGTASMIKEMQKLNKKVYIFRFNELTLIE